MLRALLLTTLVVFCLPITTAQQALPHKANQATKATIAQPLKAFHKTPALTGEEPAKGVYMPTSRNRKSDVGVEIGTTRYDLQSNATICRRVLNEGNGKVHAMWTMALQDDFGDRGTGYNLSSDSGESWGAAPTSRVEGVRTGWPNIGKTESGRLFSITHSGAEGMHFSYQDAEGGSWTDVSVGAQTGDLNGVWARAATSGNTIHAIIGRAGGDFGSGVDGGILYFRSKDAGDTWEGPTDIEPGMADLFSTGGGDTYSLDANGDNVAFAMGDFADQTALYKSTDGGDTWSRTIVVPTTDPFLTGILDPVATANGHYAVVIDDSGTVHLWFNRFYVFRDDETSDDGSVFILDDSAGIMYWNEDMGANPPILIGKTVRQDYNGDGETTIDDGIIALRGYRFGVVSQPSAGIDAAGNLYLAYSTMRDGAFQEGSDGARIYRDIYIVKSTDGGNTWVGPLNISDDPTTEDVFPHMARLVDGHVHLVFQSDEFAGTNLQPDDGHEQIVDNSIRYVKIPVGDIVDPSEPDETLPLTFRGANGFTNATIVNCEPKYAPFFSGHSIDYPDGDLTEQTLNVGIDVSEPEVDAGFWVFDITDAAGNTRIDSLVLGSLADDGETFIPDPVDVLEDVDGPVIFPEPFGGFTQDETGSVFFTTFFDLFDTVDVIVNTAYIDLEAIVIDPPGSNLNGPEFGNVYGCQPTLTIDNPVDVTTLGTYIVTYTATDINGNTQADVSTSEPIEGIERVVNVIEQDTQAPFIVLSSDANGDIDTIRVEVGSVTAWEDPGLLVFDNVDLILDDEAVIVTITDENGATVSEVDVETTGVFTVAYEATDDSDNTAIATRVVIVADTQPPVISLTPPPTVPVNCGTAYNERGFTALDNVDGIISTNVVVGFLSLGTNPPTEIDAIPNCTGNYAVTYNVTDSNGNSAAEVRRTVVVTGECADNCPGTVAIDCGLLSVSLTDGNEIQTTEGQTNLTGEYTVNFDGQNVTGSASINTDNVNFNVSGPYTATVNYEGCLSDVNINVLFTVGIEDAMIAEGVNVYPNPTNGMINVAFHLDNEIVNINVFNILGEEVGTAQQFIANQQVATIDLSNHPTGVYFIQMTTDEGSFTQKVVLDK